MSDLAQAPMLIVCGGTGGHLSPGIALAQAFRQRSIRSVLVVSKKQIDSRLSRNYPEFDFRPVPGAGFSLRPLRFLRFVYLSMAGLLAAAQLFRRENPRAVIVLGGFLTPLYTVMGFLLRKPVYMHEANRRPGRATRLFARMARRLYMPPGVRLHAPFGRPATALGFPLRLEVMQYGRDAARERFSLSKLHKVLLILGGSQGAESLNEWTRQFLHLLVDAHVQILCVTGPGKMSDDMGEISVGPSCPVKVRFMEFSDDVAALMSAADLAVCRAGAGTIAELIKCRLPSVLVPYPHSADRHQDANARYLEQCGGALVVREKNLKQLYREVTDLIFNDWLLERMRRNLALQDRENARERLVEDVLMDLGPKPTGEEPDKRNYEYA